MKKLTTEEFIKKSKAIHGDKYDYSKVEYINNHTKVCIICPEHGEFWQTPHNHLNGQNCPLCINNNLKKTKSDFINESNKLHNNKYDYSKVEYINNHTKICIICPEHGEFWQMPKRHLSGDGCPKCCGRNRTTEEFIEIARKIHGNKYDYSKTEYINSSKKVCIICPEHGEFWQIPHSHLQGKNCPKCSHQSYKHTNESFIDEAHKIHGDKYDYSKVEYINNHTPVCIICAKHGMFYQTPNAHLNGKGCSKCNESRLEREINFLLEENGIYFEREKTFLWLKNDGGNNLKLDFYLPKYNIAIECQGLQHYIAVKTMGGYNGLKRRKINDICKKKLCDEHNINIIYYGEKEKIKNKDEFLNEIKKWVE